MDRVLMRERAGEKEVEEMEEEKEKKVKLIKNLSPTVYINRSSVTQR